MQYRFPKMSFKYNKPWYRQTEVLDKLSMSNSQLKRYMTDWQKGGGDLAEMGYLKFKGFKEACWDPVKLAQWLIDNQLETIPKYDYEHAEQKRVRMGLINFNNQLRRKTQ